MCRPNIGFETLSVHLLVHSISTQTKLQLNYCYSPLTNKETEAKASILQTIYQLSAMEVYVAYFHLIQKLV